jgi:hypothetical protein
MAYKVFISYSTRDLASVEQVRNVLANQEVQVFIAEYSLPPGKSLSLEIQQAISECDLFVLLWSKNSKASEWVPQEIGIAKGQNKAILPIVLDNSLQLPAFISDLKYLDATQNANQAYLWLQKNVFQRLEKQQRLNALFGLGIAATLVWLFSKE